MLYAVSNRLSNMKKALYVKHIERLCIRPLYCFAYSLQLIAYRLQLKASNRYPQIRDRASYRRRCKVSRR